MRATLAIGVITLAGCSFHPNGARAGDGSDHGSDDAAPGSDAKIVDAPLADTPTSGFCVGNLLLVCVPDMPSDVSLTGQLDTTFGTGDSRCLDYPQVGGPRLCVISGNKVTIDNLHVSGARPLVIAAYANIEMPHALDVASHTGATENDPPRLGPGADDDGACDGGSDPGANASGGGGGAGGSYGTDGGDGGVGVAGDAAGGGHPTGNASETIVRGGCVGRAGSGNLAFPNDGGPAGHGGGAVLLSANSTIHLGGAALITAGGSGGLIARSTSGGGGGGGGTGGWIGFDAMTTTIDGNAGVFANGGGGGGGDDGANAGGAAPIVVAGEDGHTDQNAAVGGPAPAGFGGGGNGGALNGALPGQISTGAGGGGGGGGAGMIVLVHGTITGGHLSPAISQ